MQIFKVMWISLTFSKHDCSTMCKCCVVVESECGRTAAALEQQLEDLELDLNK